MADREPTNGHAIPRILTDAWYARERRWHILCHPTDAQMISAAHLHEIVAHMHASGHTRAYLCDHDGDAYAVIDLIDHNPNTTHEATHG